MSSNRQATPAEHVNTVLPDRPVIASGVSSSTAFVNAIKAEIAATVCGDYDATQCLVLQGAKDLQAALLAADEYVTFFSAGPSEMAPVQLQASSIGAAYDAATRVVESPSSESAKAELRRAAEALSTESARSASTASSTKLRLNAGAGAQVVLSAVGRLLSFSDNVRNLRAALPSFLSSVDNSSDVANKLRQQLAAAASSDSYGYDIAAVSLAAVSVIEAKRTSPPFLGLKYSGTVVPTYGPPSAATDFLPAVVSSAIEATCDGGSITVPASTRAYVDIDCAVLTRTVTKQYMGLWPDLQSFRAGYTDYYWAMFTIVGAVEPGSPVVYTLVADSLGASDIAPTPGMAIYGTYTYKTLNHLDNSYNTLRVLIDNTHVDYVLDAATPTTAAGLALALIAEGADAVSVSGHVRIYSAGARSVRLADPDALAVISRGSFGPLWQTAPLSINAVLKAFSAPLTNVLGSVTAPESVTSASALLTINNTQPVTLTGLVDYDDAAVFTATGVGAVSVGSVAVVLQTGQVLRVSAIEEDTVTLSGSVYLGRTSWDLPAGAISLRVRFYEAALVVTGSGSSMTATDTGALGIDGTYRRTLSSFTLPQDAPVWAIVRKGDVVVSGDAEFLVGATEENGVVHVSLLSGAAADVGTVTVRSAADSVLTAYTDSLCLAATTFREALSQLPPGRSAADILIGYSENHAEFKSARVVLDAVSSLISAHTAAMAAAVVVHCPNVYQLLTFLQTEKMDYVLMKLLRADFQALRELTVDTLSLSSAIESMLLDAVTA